jgi:CheY-like chemotaxis protein
MGKPGSSASIATSKDADGQSAGERDGQALALDQELLSALGHELRTPLTAIELWACSLRDQTPTPAALTCALDAILESARAQSQLIDDVLVLSRSGGGHLVLDLSAVEVGPLVRSAGELMRPSAALKHIDLQLAIADDLGTSLLDAARLRQVLLRLLANAIQCTRQGGRVTMRARRLGDELEIEVEDTRQDVPPKLLPRAWERSRRSEHGPAQLSFGLSLARHLVELHGGALEAHSRAAGVGVRLCARLPTRRVPAAGPNGQTIPAPRAARSLAGIHVLLIEDDAGLRQAMAWVLEAAGAIVRTCEDADATLALLGLGNPCHEDPLATRPEPPRIDVLLCDLGLPGIGGHELMQQILEIYGRLGRTAPAACAVSASTRADDRARAMSAGFDMYIAKPLTAEQMIEAVEDLAHVSAHSAVTKEQLP